MLEIKIEIDKINLYIEKEDTVKKLLLLLVLFLGLTGCAGNNQSGSEEELGEIHVFDEKTDGELLRNLTVELGDNKLEYPFKVKDVMDAGAIYKEEGQDPLDKLIDVKSGNFHSAKFEYQGENMFVYGINVSKEPVLLEDCLVKNLIIDAKGVTVAGITVGEDTYDTVIRKIGKNENRGDSVEEDIEKNQILKPMQLSVDYEKEIGNTKIHKLTVSFGFDSKGVVTRINIGISNVNI